MGRPPLQSRYPPWRDTVAHKESKDLTPPLSPPPVSPRALSWPHPSLPPRTLDHVGKAESGAVRADGRHSARTSSVHAGSFPYRHRGHRGSLPLLGRGNSVCPAFSSARLTDPPLLCLAHQDGSKSSSFRELLTAWKPTLDPVLPCVLLSLLVLATLLWFGSVPQHPNVLKSPIFTTTLPDPTPPSGLSRSFPSARTS